MHTVFPLKPTTATINFSATTMWRLFEGGAYSRVAFKSLMCNPIGPTHRQFIVSNGRS